MKSAIEMKITNEKEIEEIRNGLTILKLAPGTVVSVGFKIGKIWDGIRTCKGYAQGQHVKVFEGLGFNLDNDTRAACGRLYTLYKHDDVLNWVQKSGWKKVSIRALVKDYGESLKPAAKVSNPDSPENVVSKRKERKEAVNNAMTRALNAAKTLSGITGKGGLSLRQAKMIRSALENVIDDLDIIINK